MPGSYTRDLSVSEKDSTSSLNSARLVLVLLLFAILFAAASDAVAAPEEPPGAATQTPIPQDAAAISEFRIAYVAVTDKAGAPITDLKREDFSVSENGVPQRLVDLLTTSKVHLVLGLVIDVSGSAVAQTARHDRLNVLLNFLARSVGSNEEAYITAFGIRALRLTGVTNNPVELREGLKQVDAAHPHGGTALFDSLISVVSAIPPDMPGRRVLVVMSDFEENSSHHKLDDAILHAQ